MQSREWASADLANFSIWSALILLVIILCIAAHLFYSTCNAVSVSCLGQEFRSGAIVCTKRPSDNDFPEFGEVVKILLHEDAKYLLLKKMNTICFSHHYYSYKIEPLIECTLVLICSLSLHQVFHKYYANSEYFVVVRILTMHIEFSSELDPLCSLYLYQDMFI